jgi:hypothetical protein
MRETTDIEWVANDGLLQRYCSPATYEGVTHCCIDFPTGRLILSLGQKLTTLCLIALYRLKKLPNV